MIKNFKSLSYLDARDNNISTVDMELASMILEQQIENYFSGNPICQSSQNTLNCDKVCSKFCFSNTVLGDGYCQPSCNSLECHFDGGDCESVVNAKCCELQCGDKCTQ